MSIVRIIFQAAGGVNSLIKSTIGNLKISIRQEVFYPKYAIPYFCSSSRLEYELLLRFGPHIKKRT